MEVTAEVLSSPNPSLRYKCPSCGSNRGLAINKLNGTKPLVHCHAGCSQEDVIDALKAEGSWPSGGQGSTRTPTPRLRLDDPDNDESKRFERAAAILYCATRPWAPLVGRRPDTFPSAKRPDAYLRARAIKNVPENVYLLPARRGPKRRYSNFPAMITPVMTVTGIVGAHVVALNKQKNGKLAVDDPKRTHGVVKGGYVQLGQPDPDKPLIIAEGVETALSAAQLAGGLPALATCGTSGMKALGGVPSCSEVIIARDRGKAGREAAEALARRLAPHHRVRIAAPPKKAGNDWNDALQSSYDKKELRRMLRKAGPVETPKGPLDWKYQFIPDEQRLAELADAKMVIPGLVPFSQVTLLIGRANAGKTTVCMNLAAQAVQQGYKVTYVNADISADDAKTAARLAREGDFDLLLPDFVAGGKSMNDIVANLTKTAALDVDLSHEVWFFDNLKKMTDLISKPKAKILLELFRRLSAKGMTIVPEGHTNKYDGPDGNPIFEGVGDLRNDVDNLIYMIARKEDDGTTTVSFKPDKMRAPLEHMTAIITPDRKVEWSDKYIDLAELARSEQQREKDDSVIEAITEYLRGGEANQSGIIKHCQSQKIGRDTAHRVLKRYVGELWEVRNELVNNAKFYKLVRGKGGGSDKP